MDGITVFIFKNNIAFSHDARVSKNCKLCMSTHRKSCFNTECIYVVIVVTSITFLFETKEWLQEIRKCFETVELVINS